jgi:uncharacterized protein (DUF1800 family)
LSSTMNAAAVLASTRFGFAARPGELEAVARDPKGWVLGQLGRKPVLPAGALVSSAQAVTMTLEARKERQSAKRAEAGAEPRSPRRQAPGPAASAVEAPQPGMRDEMRGIYVAEVSARINAAIASDAPLQERMVHFWSNHFTVSALRPVIRGFAGAFEREAIRPNVTGRFTDMLLAVTRHPAMIFYLDNIGSIGPNSMVGQRRQKGLNENLGREILELHTLGVDGGYTQKDVEALARILTGWTVGRLVDPDAGHFRFVPQIHEPGMQTLLGRSYSDNGYAEGEAALGDLARHPATARHIATKLARHFIADDPPKPAVERIAKAFRESDGDLKRVMRAVVESPEAWEKPFAKVRTPTELVIAACRVADVRDPPAASVVGSLKVLDQTCFVAPSPAGWPDVASSWVSPEAVVRRAEWCQAFAEKLPDPPDPVAVATATFGETLSDEVLQAIRRAPSRRSGLALLLASAEFQRR